MLLPLVLSVPSVAAPAPLAQMSELQRVEIPGRIVVSFESERAPRRIEDLVEEWAIESIDPRLEVESARQLLQWNRRGAPELTTVVLVEVSPKDVDLAPVMAGLRDVPGVQWAAPSVGYLGDPRELVPDDPSYGSQYHHPLMRNDAAWDITLGDPSVVIAVTDDGVDLDHEDLEANIWTNSGEVAGDGADNDGNGYVDDVHGYDFVFDSGDANPDNGNDHGTHCGGIAGARTDNGVGVAGTAGRSTLMPVQFYATGEAWTDAIIAEAFAYATDNGARIITTSYNINGWVGNPLVTAAFDYLYDQGVLHFNSAGNGAELNPARQAFEQTLLVISTDSADAKSSFSNYGTGCDICAPGSGVFATTLNDTYGTKSGTSMAAPNAAGVAALIWSANPGWTRDQVAAQLVATGDSIDAQNPGLEGLLGGGRVNSFRALTESLRAPRVTAVAGLPDEGASVLGELSSFSIRFDQILDPSAVNGPGAIALANPGPDHVFGTLDDVRVPLVVDEYLISSNGLRVTVPGPLPVAGAYRVVVDASVVANPFGTALDGNGDGVGGDSWVRNFSACAVNVLIDDPAESGSGWSVVNESLSAGAWTVPPEVPIGGGVRNDPPTDFDGSGRCFLTENDPGNTDVDGGPTRLISRAYDLAGSTDPYVSVAVWLGTSQPDPLDVDLSDDDGATWTRAETLTVTDGWEVKSYRVADFVSPGGEVRLRFSVEDSGSPSVTEAGIDAIKFFEVDCSGSIGTRYCQISPNSVGSGATIGVTGSAQVAANDVTLDAQGLPPSLFGLFFTGTVQDQSPLGNGTLCVSGLGITRLDPAVVSSASGRVSLALDLTAGPMSGLAIPGTTSNFQLWYRDVVGAGSNLSDAVSVTWQ